MYFHLFGSIRLPNIHIYNILDRIIISNPLTRSSDDYFTARSVLFSRFYKSVLSNIYKNSFSRESFPKLFYFCFVELLFRNHYFKDVSVHELSSSYWLTEERFQEIVFMSRKNQISEYLERTLFNDLWRSCIRKLQTKY